MDDLTLDDLKKLPKCFYCRSQPTLACEIDSRAAMLTCMCGESEARGKTFSDAKDKYLFILRCMVL